jgi:hypothetical protein
MKLFGMLFSAIVVSSVVAWEQYIMESYHLTFRVDLVEGLLVKHSVYCEVSDQHDGDNTAKRTTVLNFPRRKPPTEEKWKPSRWHVVYSKCGKERGYMCFTVRTVMKVYALMGVIETCRTRKNYY